MKSLSLIILRVLFYFEKSVAMLPPPQLTGELPELLDSHLNTSPPHRMYQFVAFFCLKSEINSVDCTIIGMAALVTDRHAITAASAVRDYLPDKFGNVILKYEGSSPFCRRQKLGRKIKKAVPFPDFESPKNNPLTDIAVVFLAESTTTETENTKILVSLFNVVEGFTVTQLGWAPTPSAWCGTGTCIGTRRTFQVHILHNSPYLFRSNPVYHSNKSDHGGPVFFFGNEGRFELVGITSEPSEDKPARHTNIHPFLPFIIDQLMTHECTTKSPVYQPERWISNLLQYEAYMSRNFQDRFRIHK